LLPTSYLGDLIVTSHLSFVKLMSDHSRSHLDYSRFQPNSVVIPTN